MKALIKHNFIYIIIYIVLLCYTGYILLDEDKVKIHREMNLYVGNLLVDHFFSLITHLGDGFFALFIAIVFLFKSIRISLYILLSYASAGFVSYILKHWIYYEVYRPHFVFQYYVREQLKLVDSVDILAKHSFPSGHALSAFALFFCLIFITKNHFLKTIYFILAVLAAYSRVYLSQHWLVDVFVGSIIGVSFSILLYILFYSTNKWLQLNSSLSNLLKNKKNLV